MNDRPSHVPVIFSAILMLTLIFFPVVQGWVEEENTRVDHVPGPYRDLSGLVEDLIAVTTDMTDTDSDTIPDTVERIIGTDPESKDTDMDKLTDDLEVELNTDPCEMDSNDDGIPDGTEMLDINRDLDGDGVSNAWDRDNDGDGVEDEFDLSPFSSRGVLSSHTFEINSTGKPLYLTFQVRPEEPDHMMMIPGSYDWPEDDIAMIKDLDDSKEDLYINAVLELSCDPLPAQEDVIDYGIIVDDDRCILPLHLDRQYGRIVGMRTKMFFPSYTGEIEISLSWSVTMNSDETVSSLKADNGKYVSSMSNDLVRANSTTVDDGQKFHIEELGTEEVAFKDMNGRYLGVDSDDTVSAKYTTMEDNCKFTLLEYPDFYNIKDSEGRYVISQGGGSLKVSSQMVGGQGSFMIEEAGVRSNLMNLITYDERMSITGFTATENHGTEIGVFYSEEVEDLISTNGYIATQYLRNQSNSMQDTQDYLNSTDLSISSIREVHSHRDEAVAASMTDLNNQAISSLPDGAILPVITVMEDSSKLIDLSDISSGDVDFGAEPVTTMRTMKNTWYEVPSTDPLHPGEVIEEVDSWGMNRELAGDTASVLCYWSTGDATVVSVGDEITEWEIPEAGLEWWGITTNVYSSIKWVLALEDVMEDLWKVIKFIGSKIDILTKAGKAVTDGLQSLVKTLKITKIVSISGDVLKFLDTVAPILDVIGLCIDVGVGIFTVIFTCCASNWDSFTASVAMARFYIETAYNLVMFLIGLIPVVGTIIGIIMLIADLVDIILTWIPGVSGWQEIVMNWILSIVSGVHMYCELDMEIVSTEFTIDDKTNNGLDADDRFTIQSTIYTNVTKTKWGSQQDLDEAYLRPTYWILAPSKPEYAGESGTKWSRLGRSQVVLSNQMTDDKNSTKWDVGAWVEPGFGMANYPVSVLFRSEYKVFYEEFNYIAFWFPGLWERKDVHDYHRTNLETLYFDIMPATIHDLYSWRYITPSDPDGDTLKTEDETETDPWKWDTDGDLLGDRYEIDRNLDPLVADGDGDGLNDMIEMFMGLDPNSNDTDGDGLQDQVEREGWIVPIQYEGEEFYWHIVSDPGKNDTDGDGINDRMEYLTLQNPMSQDTDGNGILDEMLDYITIEVIYNGTAGDSPFELPDCKEMVVDSSGNLIIISTLNQSLIKMRPDGSLIWEVKDTRFNGASAIGIAENDTIYLAIYDNDLHNPLLVLNPNGTYNRTYSTVHGYEQMLWVEELFLDDEGNIYMFGIGGGEDPGLLKIAPNGTFMDYAGFGFGSGSNEFASMWNGFSGAVDSRGWVYLTNEGTDGIHILDDDLDYMMTWKGNVSVFSKISDVWIDHEDNVFICDGDTTTDRVEMFDRYRRSMYTWKFNSPMKCIASYGLKIYTGGDSSGGRIGRFDQEITIHQVDEETVDEDTDADGLSDQFEKDGWSINITMAWGLEVRDVSSSFKLFDTDDDGLNDSFEYEMGSDPTWFDSDKDGISDIEELKLGTDPTMFDTDLDGMADGHELMAGSDPLIADSDGEGLNDLQEFEIGTDPRDPDTDEDGLNDHLEWTMGWDPLNPDKDGDMMFDAEEKDKGCDPGIGDHDGDGIKDGFETIFGTDPLLRDSDGDELPDGMEVDMRLDPVNNDTDGDGMLDKKELDVGYNPFSSDSDGDGIPDGADLDFTIELGDRIVVSTDYGNDLLIENLSKHAEIEEVDPSILKSEYSGSRYILLVGEPSQENGTAGGLITELMADNPGLLTNMGETDGRCVVRYGVWNETQTIVMLSKALVNDHNRVLGILRSIRISLKEGFMISDYMSPVGFINLDSLDATRTVHAALFCDFEGNSTAKLNVSLLEEPPVPMRGESGITLDQIPLGRYLEVELHTDALIEMAELRIYYRIKDLDMNGDGDADDVGDIDESSIALYRLENATWTLLEFELNTTDIVVNGMEYAGQISVNLDHFSVFGLIGRPFELGNYTLDIGPVLDEDGNPVQDAEVILNIDDTSYQLVTDVDGFANLSLSRMYHLWSVRINITKMGYEEISYDTSIDADGRLVDFPPIFIKIQEFIPISFDLNVGPVRSMNGTLMEDVDVRITMGNFSETGFTDSNGSVVFNISLEYIGSEIILNFTKEGFESMEYSTVITESGTLALGPPEMKEIVIPDEPEDEGDYTWLIIMLIVIVILIIGIYLFMRKRSEGEMEE